MKNIFSTGRDRFRLKDAIRREEPSPGWSHLWVWLLSEKLDGPAEDKRDHQQSARDRFDDAVPP